MSQTGSGPSMSDGDAVIPAAMPGQPHTSVSGTGAGGWHAHQTDAAGTDTARKWHQISIEEVLRRENMLVAYQRVVANRGAPGVDGMTIDELGPALATRWETIRTELLSGTYHPMPVRKVEIPKPSGKGRRTLGIPTVIDRLIQQAVLQILQPPFDATFSDSSFGFRPKRSAHQAVDRAREHIAAGFDWVVDVDLEKFFDRVNHDVLMARVAKRITDKRILLLIRRYLTAGMMEGGLVSERTQGTPQGGPLSPLLSNILLDDLDKELERRGHKHVRYADDANVYVKSEAGGRRVMASIERYLAEVLHLSINREKSAVGRPWNRKFLGFTFTDSATPEVRIAPESIKRLRCKVQDHLSRGRGMNLETLTQVLAPILRGWVGYFRKADVIQDFEAIDRWLRRKLRCILWRQWKTQDNRRRELVARGIAPRTARLATATGRGPWWNAGAQHMLFSVRNGVLLKLGLVSLLDEYRRMQRSS